MFEQLSIFDIYDTKKKPFKITNPIRLIELFGGIGSQYMSLRDLGADVVPWKLVEFDKYAIKSYNAIHGTNFETTDIRDVHGKDLEIVDTDKYTYIVCYSYPCTDLSLAGLQKGMSKEDWLQGHSTRSGLLWEVERILLELSAEYRELPQVLLMENVPQVHAKKNLKDYESWLKTLEDLGYTNYWQDLNAKDYGIAQNRNRTFCVSILGNYDYKFPEPIELTTVMKDYLEEHPSEKLYLNSDRAKKLIDELVEGGKLPN